MGEFHSLDVSLSLIGRPSSIFAKVFDHLLELVPHFIMKEFSCILVFNRLGSFGHDTIISFIFLEYSLQVFGQGTLFKNSKIMS